MTRSRDQIISLTSPPRIAAPSVAVARSARRFHSSRAYGTAAGTGAGARRSGTSIHSPSRIRGCHPTPFRWERSSANRRTSAPTRVTTAFAITNLWSEIQPKTLPIISPIDVFTIWLAPHATDSVRNRVLVCWRLVIASQHVTIKRSQMKASIQRGTERRTGGTIMASAMPAKSATENCNVNHSPIETETLSPSRVLDPASDRLQGAQGERGTRCVVLIGVAIDPLNGHATKGNQMGVLLIIMF